MEDSFRMAGRRTAENPPRFRMPFRNGFLQFAPAALHARLAGLYLGRGQHVFVEKPLALQVDDCPPLLDAALPTLSDDNPQSLCAYRGKVILAVNTASQCGYTKQYAGLEALYRAKKDDGLVVLGFPCNQFGAQEPGSDAEIAEFCSVNYGVTFPLTEKIEVNGDGRHALYAELTPFADAEGHTGDIRWNFEKFLIGRDGSVIARFAPQVEPDDGSIDAIAPETAPGPDDEAVSSAS